MEQHIPHWELGGLSCESYAAFIDTTNFRTGSQSACLHSAVETPAGLAGLYQSIDAREYLGKRVRFSAFIKSELVESRCGIHIAVGHAPHPLEQAGNDSVHGSADWQKLSVVVDVSETSRYITMSVVLFGFGTLWVDDATLEIVGLDVKNENIMPKRAMTKGDSESSPVQFEKPQTLSLKPNNMDFQSRPKTGR